jgi:hypothetical protein
MEDKIQHLPVAELPAAMARAFAMIGNVTRDATNPHYRSKYATMASVMDVVRPALSANALWVTQIPAECAEGWIAYETVLWHNSGDSLSLGETKVPISKQDAQGYGLAMTYCRRYGMLAAFALASEDDDGNSASQQQQTGSQYIPPVPPYMPQAVDSSLFADAKTALKDADDEKSLTKRWTNIKRHFAQSPEQLAQLEEMMNIRLHALRTPNADDTWPHESEVGESQER